MHLFAFLGVLKPACGPSLDLSDIEASSKWKQVEMGPRLPCWGVVKPVFGPSLDLRWTSRTSKPCRSGRKSKWPTSTSFHFDDASMSERSSEGPKTGFKNMCRRGRFSDWFGIPNGATISQKTASWSYLAWGCPPSLHNCPEHGLGLLSCVCWWLMGSILEQR